MSGAAGNAWLGWGNSFDKLSEIRKQTLRERLEAWPSGRVSNLQRGPFAGERLNGLEVFWLVACGLAGKRGDPVSGLAKLNSGIVAKFPRLLLAEVDLSGADLIRATLRGADLQGANLREASLGWADLHRANLEGANLTDVELFEANLSGAYLAKANLTEAGLIGVNLNGANLVEANLNGASLVEASLNKATLNGADLRGATLRGATLRGATLRGATLRGATLRGANLNGANLNGASLVEANLNGAKLNEATLIEAQLVRTELSYANLSGCIVYGIAAWDVELTGALQTNLLITPPQEPEITIDDLEVAQFLYLMLHNAKIRRVIDTLTSKIVLILGRFTKQRKPILEALRAALRIRGYVPVLFDFAGPESKNATETVTLLARMARFVIADLTDPGSVPYELAKIVPDAHVPVQPLLLEGVSTFSMAADLWEHRDLMLPLYRYTSIDALLAAVNDKVIAPAEAKAEELQRLRTLPPNGLP